MRSKVLRWWELDDPDIVSYDEWQSWLKSIQMTNGLKEILEGVCYVMWWILWRFRNQRVFGIHQPRRDLIFEDIVHLSYTWCSSRCKSNFNWVT